MKIKIKDLAEKAGTSKAGKPYSIITILTENAEKIKAWGGSQWAKDVLKKGAEFEAEVETKKDRDGFDEMWIKSPGGGGRSFAPRNMFPEAYQVAIRWMVASGATMDLATLDKIAAYFKDKFWTMNGQAQTKPVDDFHSTQPSAPAAPGDEIRVDDIPF